MKEMVYIWLFLSLPLLVTILAAAKGEQKLPVIDGSQDLKEALQTLISLPTEKNLVTQYKLYSMIKCIADLSVNVELSNLSQIIALFVACWSVVWTPQMNDTLSEHELLEDHF